MCPRIWLNKRTSDCEAFASKSSKSIVKSSVTSTKRGIALIDAIAPGTGAKVNAFVKTVWFGFTPTARRAVARAYPPDATARQNFEPVIFANSSSRDATSPASPSFKLYRCRRPVFKTLVAASIAS